MQCKMLYIICSGGYDVPNRSLMLAGRCCLFYSNKSLKCYDGIAKSCLNLITTPLRLIKREAERNTFQKTESHL